MWGFLVLGNSLLVVSLLSLASHLHQRPPLYNNHFFWRTVHTFTLVSTSLQRPLFFCPQGGCCREVQLCIKLLVIANVHNTKKLPLSFQVNINGILIGADSYASVLLAHLHNRMSVWKAIYNNTMPYRMLAHTNDDGLSVLL